MQMLEAAASVIAERGMADTRISDIAERVGVSPALVLYYFGSKDELLGEALVNKDQQFIEVVTKAMAPEPSPARKLVILIEASCPTRTDGKAIDDEYVLWIEAWARSRHDEGLAASRRAMDERWRQAIADVVREGQESGEFDGDVDPDDFSLNLSALLDGLAIQVVLGDDHVSPEDMRRLCLLNAGSRLGVQLV